MVSGEIINIWKIIRIKVSSVLRQIKENRKLHFTVLETSSNSREFLLQDQGRFIPYIFAFISEVV